MLEHLVRRIVQHVGVVGAIVLVISSPAFGDHYQRQPGIDVRHYAFKLELKAGTSLGTGETDIDLLFNADGVRELFLDLVGTSADGVLSVALHQTQASDTVYRTALDLGIITDRNAAPNVEVLQLDRRDQTFRITQDKEPSEVVLDPNTWLLMRAGTFTKKAPSQSR